MAESSCKVLGLQSLTIHGDQQPDAILTVAPGGALTVSGVTLDGGANHNSGIAGRFRRIVSRD